MSNFQHVPVDLSCKLFDSLIRPIILYKNESSGNRTSSDFAAMLLEVIFIPKNDLQNL
jgi:hypothetical protein